MPWPLFPHLGFIGQAALREAFDGDFRQLEEILRGALKKLFKLAGGEDPWPYVQALFQDSVVVERDGKLWRYPYTIDGTEVTLGEPVEVIKTYEPASGGHQQELATGAFVEAADDKAARWRIRVIRAGLSGNATFYPDAVLREAVPLFDGARVFVKADEEHLRGKGKDVRNLIGRLVEPAFVESKDTDSGEIQAVFELIEPGGDVAVKLREAWDRGMSGLFGFSINAVGPVKRIPARGRPVRAAKAITKVNSVDLIVEPGAGGEVINLIEARSEDKIMDREQLIALLEAKGLLKDKDVDSLSDEELTGILTEALEENAGNDDANRGGGEDDGGATMREAAGDVTAVTREDLQMIETRAAMRAAVNASALPDAARARIIGEFSALERFTEADVSDRIREEGEYLASFTESGAVQGLGDTIRIESGETRAEKVAAMLEAFFDPEHADHRHARSFRECYVQITGDNRVTGQLGNCDQALLREALDSGTFADVLGNSITRRLVADYNTEDLYSVWRHIVDVVSVNDFRTQERTRFGGYGDIPAVAEKGAYTELNSPADEKATYAVTKRGGTESVTIEMIKNDDAGAIRRIPMKLAKAAKRTLSKFVLDFIKDNPVIYDGVALYHVSHNNLFTAALADAAYAAHRLAMKNQTEMDSGDPLGIPPRILLVPDDLEETAYDMFRRDTNNDETFVQTLKPRVIPVWYWTDPNDWAAVADPNDIPFLEIGFLDGNEEPELFVQDNPTAGSMFSHDKLTWKIRHVYGGTVVDYRGTTKAVVISQAYPLPPAQRTAP